MYVPYPKMNLRKFVGGKQPRRSRSPSSSTIWAMTTCDLRKLPSSHVNTNLSPLRIVKVWTTCLEEFRFFYLCVKCEVKSLG